MIAKLTSQNYVETVRRVAIVNTPFGSHSRRRLRARPCLSAQQRLSSHLTRCIATGYERSCCIATVFKTIYAMLTPLIPERTHHKIKILGSADELKGDVDEDQL